MIETNLYEENYKLTLDLGLVQKAKTECFVIGSEK